MKKIFTFAAAAAVLLAGIIHVHAAESFNSEEYAAAITVGENQQTELSFDSDILIKVDVSDKSTATVFELSAESYSGIGHYYIFTAGGSRYMTQNNTVALPGYISVPHINGTDSSYIKIDYAAPENAELRNKTLKLRLITISNDISDWQSAASVGLNEEHKVKFNSMSKNLWYKLVVPDEKFRYTYSIENSYGGCFISEIYSEDDLKAGTGKSSFSSCIRVRPVKSTVTATMGAGTYYIRFCPVPLDNSVLDTELIFATDNKDSSEVVTTSFGAQASQWAAEELERAHSNNLIPEKMLKFDLTKKINRGEFAAIAMQLYEAIADTTVPEAAECRFTDISGDVNEREIKKAYTIDVAQGTSETTYESLSNITREQLATMLCRVIKKYAHPEWTMAQDSRYDFKVGNIPTFADNDEISDWAKPSVYFMAANDIVKGVDSTHFAPKNTTGVEEAQGYAHATREQAIIMAQRIWDKADTFE